MDLIEKARNVNRILKKTILPQVVFTGAQSSGKSSVINKLIGYDILPTGKEMVTKTPILIKTEYSNQINTLVVIGYYDPMKNQKISHYYNEEFRNEHILDAQKALEELTNKFVNDGDISEDPLFLVVVSRHVKNLELIDLPGIIAIAREDKNQTDNTIDKIINLATKYITSPKSIIVTIVESKIDLETDIGLSLVKKLEKTNNIYKTIGIFTKLDKIGNDNESRIFEMIGGNISKSLNLSNGYFVVNNIVKNENEYFEKHNKKINSTYVKSRIGINSVRSYLSDLLIESIKNDIPIVLSDIIKEICETKEKLNEIGEDIMETEEVNTYIISIITKIITNISQSINSNGSNNNIGLELSNLFSELNEKLIEVQIFQDVSIEYFNDRIKKFRSFKIDDTISVSTIINMTMNDDKIDPYKKIYEIFDIYINKITEMIKLKVIEIIDNNLEINKYPLLGETLKKYYNDDINNLSNKVIDELKKIIDDEKSFIHTTNRDFIMSIKQLNIELNTFNMYDSIYDIMYKKQNNNEIKLNKISKISEKIKTLCEKYMTIIKGHMYNNIIKKIMSNIIKQLEKNSDKITEKFKINNIKHIFSESDEITETRKMLKIQLDKLIQCEKILISI